MAKSGKVGSILLACAMAGTALALTRVSAGTNEFTVAPTNGSHIAVMTPYTLTRDWDGPSGQIFSQHQLSSKIDDNQWMVKDTTGVDPASNNVANMDECTVWWKDDATYLRTSDMAMLVDAADVGPYYSP